MGRLVPGPSKPPEWGELKGAEACLGWGHHGQVRALLSGLGFTLKTRMAQRTEIIKRLRPSP